MQVAKLGASGAPNAMKSDEGNDSLDTFIHQTMGKESLVSFSRTGDNPVQWIQLLNSLDQPDLLGWPLFTPMKIQLRKCEKCSVEFCSPINYRRHTRMHRRRSRSLNVDKESHKSRDLLGSFWDNLSLEDAKNVVSFDDISLKEVSGSAVVKALANALRKPGAWTMPQTYVKAGSILLEIVQGEYSRLPIYSQELFIILDDASERTFLCAGTAESVQKFIIDGGAEEALEMRNLIASVSLLFEQKLVRAWLADKDAESLRCQKLLVEEEEAAEKRRSQLLERRKLKQLRQQEQKAREQSNSERIDDIADSGDSCTDSVDVPSVAESSVSQVSSKNSQGILTDLNSFIKPPQDNEATVEARSDFSSDQVNDDSLQNFVSLMEIENGPPVATINGWQVPKSRSQRSGRNVFYGSQNLRTLKPEPSQKQGLLKDTVVNSGKVWTRKSKEEISDASLEINLQKIEANNIGRSNSDLLIGSISVPVRSSSSEKYATQGASNAYSMDSSSSKDNSPKEILKSNSAQEEIDQATARLITTCAAERSNNVPVQSVNQDYDIVTSGKVIDNSGDSRETCLQACPTDMENCGKISHLERNYQPHGMLFSSDAAKAFLAKRWKDAISADHVTLVLSHEAPGRPDGQNDSSLKGVPSSGVLKHCDRGDSETHLPSTEACVTPPDEDTKTKFKGSQRKGRPR